MDECEYMWILEIKDLTAWDPFERGSSSMYFHCNCRRTLTAIAIRERAIIEIRQCGQNKFQTVPSSGEEILLGDTSLF